MIVLDTDVLSAAIKEVPEPIVVEWLDARQFDEMWITSVTVMEVLMGIEKLPAGRKRTTLESAFMGALGGFLKGRVLDFDLDAAWQAGRLYGRRRGKGRTVGVADTQIAGIAITNGATVATRNVADFVDLGVPVINPWQA